MGWHALANPARFLKLSARLKPWLAGLALLGLAVGLYKTFFDSPPDYQQGETVRIMYLHVPAAWLAMMGYTMLAACSASLLIWKHPLAALAARALAPLGGIFTGICLVTGMLWGKPTWGTFWVWDARLTSVLVLFFLYLGHITLTHAFTDRRRADTSAALLALLGIANLPVIKFSVDWWQTLHQPASISSLKRLASPAVDPAMLSPLLWMTGGLTSLFLLFFLLHTERELFRYKAETRHG